MNDPYKYCHNGYPGITDQPGYKPLHTEEEVKIADKKYGLKHRPISPDIHDREDRKWFKLPPCTCEPCRSYYVEPISHTEPPENYQ